MLRLFVVRLSRPPRKELTVKAELASTIFAATIIHNMSFQAQKWEGYEQTLTDCEQLRPKKGKDKYDPIIGKGFSRLSINSKREY